MAPRAREGLPKPDTRRLGQYHPVNRTTDPGAFRTLAEQAASDQRYAASEAALEAMMVQERVERARPRAQSESAEGSVTNVAVTEVDDDDTGDYEPGRPSTGRPKGKKRAESLPPPTDNQEEEEDNDIDQSGPVAADALSVDAEGWKVGQPKSTPITYYVHSDDHGGVKAMSLSVTVDFNDKASIATANKRRSLAIWRSCERFGLNDQKKRASTKGREYTKENDDWIIQAHIDYAASNNNRQIPFQELTNLYNGQFPTENRTTPSITSHMDRRQHLKDMRNGYVKLSGK